jgi:hypothetical protein
VAAIEEITHRYIVDRQSTPAHSLKAQLLKKRQLLDKAAQDGYLLNLCQKYLPCYPALEFRRRVAERTLFATVDYRNHTLTQYGP